MPLAAICVLLVTSAWAVVFDREAPITSYASKQDRQLYNNAQNTVEGSSNQWPMDSQKYQNAPNDQIHSPHYAVDVQTYPGIPNYGYRTLPPYIPYNRGQQGDPPYNPSQWSPVYPTQPPEYGRFSPQWSQNLPSQYGYLPGSLFIPLFPNLSINFHPDEQSGKSTTQDDWNSYQKDTIYNKKDACTHKMMQNIEEYQPNLD
ncbi:unnamed protein product [Cylicocyclus nassatus]|uniref:Uncharacterized protein n=1 Tax=Cylicocyclus nassatus TaxID=53992 RepID=A0AA36HF29_CYLNA|nr:unnamed protein product [Cylicocyclus nassatus]